MAGAVFLNVPKRSDGLIWSGFKMTNDELTWSGDEICYNGQVIKVEYPVKDAFVWGKLIIVLYKYWDYTKNTPFNEPIFHSLVAYNLDGQKVWTSELPNKANTINYHEGGAHTYLQIISQHPLIAYTWSGFECEIDISTGKLLSVVFVK